MKPLLFLVLLAFLTLPAFPNAPKDDGTDRLRNALSVSKPDTNRVRLWLSLTNWYQSNTINRSQQYSDSALYCVRQAEMLSRLLKNRPLLGETLLAKSEVLLDVRARQPGQKREARLALNEALQIYEAAADRLRRADATFLIGMIYPTPDTARLPYLQSALGMYKELGNRERIANALGQIALTDKLNGNLQKSTRTYLDVLAIQESIHDKTIGTTLDYLSMLYGDLGDYPKALQYAYWHYRIARQSRDSLQLQGAYLSLASIHELLGDHKMALQYNQAAFHICRKNKQTQAIVVVGLRLCRSLLALGRPQEALNQAKSLLPLTAKSAEKFNTAVLVTLGNCYAALKDYPKAEACYLESLPDSPVFTIARIHLYQVLGTLYLNTNQLSKAASNLNQAFLDAQKVGTLKDRRTLALQLYRLDSTRGHYQSALAHHLQYTALNDSSINEAKNKQIALLQIQFDTDKKEQEIKSLQRQRNLQQVSIDQDRLIRNSTFVGLVMLAILLWLTFNRYRLKQRSNQQLQAQQVEIAHKNESLQSLVTEKEWLLKEVHHRVKNNLQIISSLLHSQGVYLTDQAAVSAIRESQSRVQVMALIHQKLYQSDRLTSIPMGEYIPEIVDYLISSFDCQHTVRKQFRVTPVELDVTIAVPLGLIINEIVTNSLKYAFPQGQAGLITVDLTCLDSHNYRLTISDNGLGLPADFNLGKSRTLGMSLIRGLSEQLGGKLKITSENGVQTSLVFTDDKEAKPHLADA